MVKQLSKASGTAIAQGQAWLFRGDLGWLEEIFGGKHPNFFESNLMSIFWGVFPSQFKRPSDPKKYFRPQKILIKFDSKDFRLVASQDLSFEIV